MYRYFSIDAVTKPFDYRMENGTELMNKIGSVKLIICLDVLNGHWEIPLEKQSQVRSSFKTHNTQYRSNVMSFGLSNAGATFQKSMNDALGPHRKYYKTYLDNIAIFQMTEIHILNISTMSYLN